ncbi:oxygen-independent coproporphyrinogen III oxidase [Hydrogenimonas thermophila]|uniref:oxygen-independent coproporphyrinogen III oxidase n=1 Tax=Hydrogenimonas thermophila TaxID=223786 RepID=UPI002936D9D8|nr:oxygen-independent coproporphyrinogen III oxidase [Hydrogenimonas thermophila]WOE69480.1 oxygen-independent coproporphyrinogen III oxidase [Hydrogenimonas thermophila]WOE71991.1 oxygen-independent coproporphyrinogen III oxidase [Hydrogenimonas thermophila]
MIDFKQFIKYSKPGPRYTSYPTAVEFSEDFAYDRYIEKLKNRDVKKPISIYIHLPFCRSACYFCGCNVVFTSKEEKKVRYIDYLTRELDLLSQVMDTSVDVVQFHFGGGTPTFFSAEQLDDIMNSVKKHFPNFTKDAEVSCEIDPRFFNEEQMKVLQKHGFKRISFGVQDFEPIVQQTVHRIQPYDITKDAVELARKYGVESINIDLIYGLPYQTLESFKNTLEMAHSLDPDRLAVFNYAHVPWLKKTMRKLDETTIPSPDVKLAILQHTIDYFTNNGYKMIGMDHFAKPDDELFKAIDKGELHRNFQGYTTRGGVDLIGVGVTSIGEGRDYYAQNYKDLPEYEAAIDAGKLPFWRGVELNEDDLIRKSVIMELMSNFKLDIKRVEKEFGIDFNDYFADSIKELQPMVDEGLVQISDKEITVSQTGTLVIRNIAMPFDAYMKKHASSKKTFSKTV